MVMNILAVDDKEENLYSLESLLSELKFDNEEIEKLNIIKALDGEEALRIALSQKIDLIILDIQMPVMDGFEVSKFLKSNNATRDIPTIFLTAVFKADEFVKRGFDLGAIDYFTKPIEKYSFLNKIKLYINLFINSKKLKNINEKLKEEIKKEVEYNREKEKIFFNQSRMAQLGEMLGNIAHQWRQPLSIISMNMNTILADIALDTVDNKKLKEYVNNSIQQAKYLSQTIDTFRNFIKEKKELKEVILQDEINEILNIVTASLRNNFINIIEDIDSQPIAIKIVSDELAQVLMNVINNAKDVLKDKEIDKKWIKISLVKDTKNVTISIEDNGGGVPKDIESKIFDPYFTTKHESQGTGLGLYLSYEIITKSLRGKLYSKNTQNGAKFFIELPLEI